MFQVSWVIFMICKSGAQGNTHGTFGLFGDSSQTTNEDLVN